MIKIMGAGLVKTDVDNQYQINEATIREFGEEWDGDLVCYVEHFVFYGAHYKIVELGVHTILAMPENSLILAHEENTPSKIYWTVDDGINDVVGKPVCPKCNNEIRFHQDLLRRKRQMLRCAEKSVEELTPEVQRLERLCDYLASELVKHDTFLDDKGLASSMNLERISVNH